MSNPYLGEVSLVTGGSGGYLGEVSLTAASIAALSVADVASFVPGKPSASLVMLAYLPAHSITLPQNMTLSRAKASIAATASTTFLIQKNGVTVGNINFALGATVGTFTLAAAVVVGVTDELTVVAPLVVDATLSDVRFTIAASRT